MRIFDDKWAQIFCCFLIAAVYVYLFNLVDYFGGTDDDHFLHVLDNTALFPLLKERYFGISGRIPLEALMFTTIGIPLFWKLAIPSCIMLICYCIWRIALKGALDLKHGMPLVILLYFLADKKILFWSNLWVTGFYNYLLPVSLGLFAITVFNARETFSKYAQAAAIPCLIVACYSEQAAIAMLVVTAAILIARLIRRQANFYDCLFTALLLVNTAVFFASPGSQLRIIYETARWMPEFDSYGLMARLTLGTGLFSEYFQNIHNLLAKIACLLVLYIVVAKKLDFRFKYLVCFFLAALVLTFDFTYFQKGKDFYIGERFSPEVWNDHRIYLVYFFCLATLSSMFYAGIFIAATLREFVSLSLLLFLCFGLVAALGFSPTIYASGERVLYLSSVLLIIYIAFLIRILLDWHTRTFEASGKSGGSPSEQAVLPQELA